MARKRARTVAIALIWTLCTAALSFGLIMISFYAKAPAAVRIFAKTGSLQFATPGDARISNRLVWPLDSSSICSAKPTAEFSIEPVTSNWHCDDENINLSGTLWFESQLLVDVISHPDRAEVEITTLLGSPPKSVEFRSLDGTTKQFATPLKLMLDTSRSTAQNIVFPLVSQDLRIGSPIRWQSLRVQPVMQGGHVTLVRESFFGDELFSSDSHELLLGDLVRMSGQESDIIQGLVQITHDRNFDVVITMKQGEAWLHRLSRDPIRLNAPFAIHIVKDPTLIVTWAALSLLIGALITALQTRAALKPPHS